MKQVLACAAAFGLLFTPLLGPVTAEAHWGRCGGWYSSRYYSSSCSSWYGPSYRYCYSPCSYGYPGYSSYGYGYGFPGYGYSGNSFSNFGYAGILGLQGLLGSGQSSYLSIPMGGGMGPTGYMQVPVGGGSNRPTYMQVPVGGTPAQPIYLQVQLGSTSEPAPSSAVPAGSSSVRPTAMSERVALESYPSDRVDPAPVAVTKAVARKAIPATTPVVESDEPANPSRGIFRFAGLHQEVGTATADESAKSPTVNQTVGTKAQSSVAAETATPALDLGPQLGNSPVRSLRADNELPWVVQPFQVARD